MQNAVGYMIKPSVVWMFSVTSVTPSPILLHTTTASRRDHDLTATSRTHDLTATRRTQNTTATGRDHDTTVTRREHDIDINEPP